jgi:hypothetical protein
LTTDNTHASADPKQGRCPCGELAPLVVSPSGNRETHCNVCGRWTVVAYRVAMPMSPPNKAWHSFVEDQILQALRSPRASVRAHMLSILDGCHRQAVQDERADDVAHLEAIQGTLGLYWRTHPATE